ncbi:ArsR family transcriptional regulator [Massilia cavernae]|uniref:ArsR family transcriptional regulator n=1 Tax=Massilia cavernae TaxID=2320864 RepID=A0A418XGN1_9BURK|nr:ArsR family transcriptional regulator [Massilia cavernae]RJG11624.1 ArsR family transcriptional regulator [Massilia cavernae]
MDTRTHDSCLQSTLPLDAIEPVALLTDAVNPAGVDLRTAGGAHASLAAVRQSPSTARRIENMRLLIAKLAVREMRLDEVAQFLNSSMSAARVYVLELCSAGLVTAVRDRSGTHKGCKPAYRLSSNPERNRAFFDNLENSSREAGVIARKVRGKRGQVAIAAGRSVHIMADDVQHPIRIDDEPVRRDPLVAALFGAATVFA